MLDKSQPGAPMPSYWERYYAERKSQQIAPPSQFATFVLGEIHRPSTLFDIGCGNGRDSLFFAAHGLTVHGVDAASPAIDYCSRAKGDRGLNNVQFHCSDVEDPSLYDRLGQDRSGPVTVYARFFLHAISDDQEVAFLRLASRLCKSAGTLALEFRTVRDVAQKKVTPDHFRRFLDPLSLIHRVSTHGFHTRYFVEGFGLAKFRDDDAYVARCIFERTC